MKKEDVDMNLPEGKIHEYLKYTESKVKKRTFARLKEIFDIGLQEVGEAQFGVPGIMSGLYIEMIWSFDHKMWNEYVEWMKELIATKKQEK